MKSIKTLIEDIDTVLLSGVDSSDQNKKVLREFGERVSSIVEKRLCSKRQPPSLRISGLGKNPATLWHEIHGSPKDEEMGPEALLKFLYGDIIEELLLTLAELSGHAVTCRQKEVEVAGVVGHIDCLIDGELVDVKSASSQSFNKFQFDTLKDSDSFGYYTQLSGYAKALNKPNGYFLSMDKTLGYTCLLEMKGDTVRDVETLIPELKAMLAAPTPPVCNCEKGVEKNGNEYLKAPCSYSPYKSLVHPEVRTFIYSTGLKHYTKVVKEPLVQEVTKKNAG
jgi:hypothetical protein